MISVHLHSCGERTRKKCTFLLRHDIVYVFLGLMHSDSQVTAVTSKPRSNGRIGVSKLQALYKQHTHAIHKYMQTYTNKLSQEVMAPTKTPGSVWQAVSVTVYFCWSAADGWKPWKLQVTFRKLFILWWKCNNRICQLPEVDRVEMELV